jgi:hypothetical protein
MLNKTTMNAIRNADNDTLDAIISMVRARRSMISQEIKGSFSVGDAVFFNDKRGMKVTGTILKINPKTIRVSTTNGMWKVSPSLLKAS